MKRLVVTASVAAVMTSQAFGELPARLIAVTSGFPPVLSWEFPTPGPWSQVARSPVGEFRLYASAATDSLGNLYVSSYTVSSHRSQIEKLAAGTGELVSTFTASTSERLSEMAFTADGDLLVTADFPTGWSVRRYGPDGTYLSTPVMESGHEIDRVRVGPDGRGYAGLNNLSTGNSHIAIFDPVTGESFGSIASPVRFGDFDFGADGNIYLLAAGQVFSCAPTAGAPVASAFQTAGFSISSFAAGPDGRWYYASNRSILVSEFDGAGGLSTFATGPVGAESMRDFTFGTVVPAPASVALLGLAAAPILRRRR